jgi:hypothetical protein
MKHLKKFNESVHMEELQDFCDTYLAYLLDEGYLIEVSDIDLGESIIILKKGKRPSNMPLNSPEFLFAWDEIKDQFIPFLHMLSKQYAIIGSIKFYSLNKKFDRGTERPFIDYDYSLPMVLEDRVSLEEVVQINIYLK